MIDASMVRDIFLIILYIHNILLLDHQYCLEGYTHHDGHWPVAIENLCYIMIHCDTISLENGGNSVQIDLLLLIHF